MRKRLVFRKRRRGLAGLGCACKPPGMAGMGGLQLVNPLAGVDAGAVDAAIVGARTNAQLYKALAPVFDKATALLGTARNASRVISADELGALEAAYARLQASRNGAKVRYANAPNSAPAGVEAARNAVAGMLGAAGVASSVTLGTPLQRKIVAAGNKAGEAVKKAADNLVPGLGNVAKWALYVGAAAVGVYALGQVATIAKAVRGTA